MDKYPVKERGSHDEFRSHGDVTGIGAASARRAIEPPASIGAMSYDYRVSFERKLVQKIDFRLLPMVIIMYIMNYLDRNNIATARLAGLEDELQLTSAQFQLAVSILFVGYVLMQVPSNLLLNKIGRPSIYLSTCMVVWGLVSTLTGTVNSYGGLVAVRFALGFVEAAYFPGCLYFLSCWYTRKELGFRTAILYSGSLISGAFSGLITAGVADGMDGARGLRAWRWIFYIEGAITIVIAIAAAFILPNFPRTTKWLSEEERELAIYRLEEDIGMDDWTGSADQTFWHGFKLAITDIKVFILAIQLTAVVNAASITNFFPTVVETLGYNPIPTLLLTAPPYVLAVITSFLNAWHADRTGERYRHISLPLLVGIAAFILASATTAVAPRYVAMMLMLSGIYPSYVVILGYISNCIPRPPSKRAASLAFINAVSNCAQIWASYLYPKSAGPRYAVAMSVNCATLFVALVMATILYFMLQRLNKKLDRGEHVDGVMSSGGAVPEEAAGKGFRFLL
ncbi:pantothenate transporter liz1 [Eremomyces bilateralis CBS 781.70]|uniref:Pantothenate transporter liz1 n=1 Tax=Eremomyces bilateralis CBS 781.70 TaxID=1392243 RepID=A0A6G1G184_9PEZI|nr:pantothenate transporter liz1 [Eremomyces bilateralis CBS 781.70]KAF1811814.1 pantothenate transporter liz1 [Eremomyces bilateralis CBS 781.70]